MHLLQSLEHTPVMKEAVITVLQPFPGGTYVDATFGRGGHTLALLAQGACHVIAFDRDPQAIAYGKKIIREHGLETRITLVHGKFSTLFTTLQGVGKIHGIVMDLGTSLPQLKDASRGFSWMHEGPLDMGMGLHETTAHTLLHTLTQAQLAHVLWTLGNEPNSRRIAKAIVNARQKGKLSTTKQLAALIVGLIPPKHGSIHPATKTFQALRMLVNDEIQEIKQGLVGSIQLLQEKGRLCVLSFHSGEDSLVKTLFYNLVAKQVLWCPKEKVFFPAPEEIHRNAKARSVRLRWAERTAFPF